MSISTHLNACHKYFFQIRHKFFNKELFNCTYFKRSSMPCLGLCTMGCLASKTDIHIIQVKMKVKNLIFSMAYLILLYSQGPPKLILGLWDSYKWCYDPKNMGEYPKNIWKMAIFWKSYTGQGQTACLLVKVVQFFIVMTALYPVFAPIRSGSSHCSLKLVIFLLFLAIFGGLF